MDDSKLIELVQQHPCLYNPKNQHYKDINVRDNVWMGISEAVKQPVEECRNRWENIRDTFMRHKRNKKMPTGSTLAQTLPKWHLEEYLVFLNQVENERETLTNTTTQEDTGDYNSDEDNHPQTEDVEIEKTQENTGNEATGSLEPINMNETVTEQQSKKGNETELKSNKQHSTKTSAADKIVEIFQRNAEARQKLWLNSIGKKTEDEHPIDVFFRSMATSVKKLSEDRQIRAKMQICQIVGQLELEEITSRSSSKSMSTHDDQDMSRPTSAFSSYASSIPTSNNDFEFLTNTSDNNFD